MKTNPFWTYSGALYAHDGVAEACLRLQDNRGFDVNLLLFASWALHRRGVRLGERDWRRLIAATQSWRETVLTPLRTVRRRLKGDSLSAFPGDREQLRAAILKIELDCEKSEQDFLASSLDEIAASQSNSALEQRIALDFHPLARAMAVVLDAQDEADLAALSGVFARF